MLKTSDLGKEETEETLVDRGTGVTEPPKPRQDEQIPAEIMVLERCRSSETSRKERNVSLIRVVLLFVNSLRLEIGDSSVAKYPRRCGIGPVPIRLEALQLIRR